MKQTAKKIYRFIKYKHYREKIAREKSIVKIHKREFSKEFNSEIKKAIVFIVPGADKDTGKETMSGGVISILSIAAETKDIFKNNKEVAILVCTHTDDFLLVKYQNIENKFIIYSFNQIVENFKGLEEIIIHVTDYAVTHFVTHQPKKEKKYLAKLKKVHFNIMNQNIKLMPKQHIVNKLKTMYNLVTITTAHQQYSTQYYREFYDVPLHKFSVWISPEQYEFVDYKNKENLLVYSLDFHPLKEEILKSLRKINGLQLQEIIGLTYSDYKKLIRKAKWSLTFGEGLDGYFIEPVFSGAISFAVYNKEFFTESFKGLQTVYSSYSEMIAKIVEDIEYFESNTNNFKQYQNKQFNLCEELYNSKVYRSNIEKFYNHKFTFA